MEQRHLDIGFWSSAERSDLEINTGCHQHVDGVVVLIYHCVLHYSRVRNLK